MSVHDTIHVEYRIKPDVAIDLRGLASVNSESVTKHKHVTVTLDDGSVIWLDIDVSAAKQNYVDVRWFNPDAEMKGIGAFTIVNGRRQQFNGGGNDTGPLLDAEGHPVTGGGWNGGYVMTLLVDKNGIERAARKPSPGNG